MEDYIKSTKNNLLRFAEWTSFEGWYLKEMDLWWTNKVHGNLGVKSTEELYELFVKEKK